MSPTTTTRGSTGVARAAATIAEVIVCGPEPQAHLDGIRRFADAGFDHVYVHQVGPEQGGFIDFCAREILGEPAEGIEPRARRVAA